MPSRWKAFLATGLCAAPLLAQEPLAEPPAIPIGMNLKPVSASDRAWVFADAMKAATAWRYEGDGSEHRRDVPGRGAAAAGDDERVPLSADGWPLPASGRSVSCRLFVDMCGRFPRGPYVCAWKGSGAPEFGGSARVVSSADHRLVIDVDPSLGAIEVRIDAFDPEDPLREIRLWPSGLEDASSSFHPRFLERLRPFSVLRFYPWMRIYTSSGRWDRRSSPATARQSNAEGVAVEYMVELCNELGADPWFCIPHTADEEYVRRFAELVRDSLRPGARVWVEFSNELWNGDLVSGRWASQEARRLGVSATEVTADAAREVFRAWREVFAEDAGRVVRVAGAQLHDPGVAQALCRRLDGEFDAIAVGAYFGVRADRDEVDVDSTAAELMEAARSNLDRVLLRIAEHKAIADRFSEELGRHVALVAYEGGPSIVARSPGGALDPRATIQCQNLPALYDAYRVLLEEGARRGLELFVAYDFVGERTSSDTFSHLQTLDEPIEDAPKYRALIEGWEARPH